MARRKCEVCKVNSGERNLCKKCGWWLEEIMRWRDNLWVIKEIVSEVRCSAAARRAGWFPKKRTPEEKRRQFAKLYGAARLAGPDNRVAPVMEDLL